MNHRVSQRKLNRTSAHRRAMQRNLAQSLFEHGEIRSTLPKVKDVRPFAERLISLAKRARRGDLVARRRIHRLMGERSLVPAEHRGDYEGMSDAKRRQTLRARSGRRFRTGAAKGHRAFTGESVTHRLINTVAPQFEDRPGGYTRVIKLADRRVGDQGALAILQLVGDEESPGGVARPAKSARRRRADARYAAAVKASKARSKSPKATRKADKDAEAAPESSHETTVDDSGGSEDVSEEQS
jgi:large subunit ribosomal protein L17